MKKLVNTMLLGFATIGIVGCTSSSGLSSLEIQTIKNEVIAANQNLDVNQNLIFNYEKSKFQVSQNKVYVSIHSRHAQSLSAQQLINKNIPGLYTQTWKRKGGVWQLTQTEKAKIHNIQNEPAIVNDNS